MQNNWYLKIYQALRHKSNLMSNKLLIGKYEKYQIDKRIKMII